MDNRQIDQYRIHTHTGEILLLTCWRFVAGLLLVFGAFLAFETRQVSVPALNDSKFIGEQGAGAGPVLSLIGVPITVRVCACVCVFPTGISVYNVVVLCLVGVPIALMMKEQLDASYVLISLFIFFATTVTICLVFIPKVSVRSMSRSVPGQSSGQCEVHFKVNARSISRSVPGHKARVGH